jgi:hypothetical protein
MKAGPRHRGGRNSNGEPGPLKLGRARFTKLAVACATHILPMSLVWVWARRAPACHNLNANHDELWLRDPDGYLVVLAGTEK